jgi:type II secretory pathway pseudopilin PulG
MKKNKKTKYINSRGMTLVEALVYISLFAILLVGVINAVMMLTTSYKNVRLTRSIENTAISSIDRMVREIKSARSIDFGNSSFSSSPGSLSLNTIDDEENESNIRFFIQNYRLYIQESGVNLGPLSPSGIAVSSLVFRNITSTSSSAIKIEMTLTGTSTNPESITKNFQTTAILKNDY